MSIDAARKFIEAKLANSQSDLAKKFLADYRTSLNINTQLLDISLETFRVNNKLISNPVNDATLNSYHKYFIRYIRYIIGSSRIFENTFDPKLDELLQKENSNRQSINLCILVQNGGRPYIIGYSYEAIRKVIYNVSRSEGLKGSFIGAKFKATDIDLKTGEILKGSYKSTLELGHLGTGSGTETSNLAEKILAVSNVSNISSTLQVALVTRLQTLYTLQANLGYSFQNISNAEAQKRTDILGKGFISLVIQPGEVNRKFSPAEAKIYSQFLLDVVRELDPAYIPGSNTIIEDSIQNATNKIFSVFKEAKIIPVKSHTKVLGKVALKLPKPKVIVEIPRLPKPQLRAPTGHFTSLTSIQNIINQSLAEQIRTNMGTGSRKDVLNYRTGRFAGSARVERMSQSRDGMVTAFYSYMRNPYGTFSTGGAQEYPKTRDPKLLISKSIREIGVQAATNRMRAVLV